MGASLSYVVWLVCRHCCANRLVRAPVQGAYETPLSPTDFFLSRLKMSFVWRVPAAMDAARMQHALAEALRAYPSLAGRLAVAAGGSVVLRWGEGHGAAFRCMHRAALAEHGADGGAPDIVALNLTARAWSAVMWALGALGALFAYTAGAVAFALGAPVMRVELDVFRGMDEEAGGGTSLVRLEWAHAVADGATVNGFVAALADAYAADARAPRAPTPALPDGPVDPGTIRLARQLVVADGGGGLYAPTPGVGFAFRRFVLPVDVAPGADRRAALRAGFASAVARVWRLLARSARSNDSAAAIPSLRFVIDMRGAADAGRALAGNALRWGAAIAAPEQLVADVRTGAATIIAHQRVAQRGASSSGVFGTDNDNLRGPTPEVMPCTRPSLETCEGGNARSCALVALVARLRPERWWWVA